MARRILLGLLLCGAASVSVAACDAGAWGYYGYGGGRSAAYICGQYTSCGACTPVVGCGWCSFNGGGACLAEPDDCGVNAFSWTWEPSGCGEISDAGPQDGAVPPRSDAAAPRSDAAAPGSDAAADH